MIVFLHGWGMDKVIFNGFVDAYLDGEQVILLDLPGYGKEPWVANFDDQVAQLIEKIPKGAHLIAWSLAGLYALKMVSQYSGHLSRLTMVCSTPCFAQKEGYVNALPSEVLNQFSEQLIQNRAKTIDRFLLLQLHGQAKAKELVRDIKARVIAQPEVRSQVLEFGLLCLRNLDCRDDLRLSKTPTQFILGEKDKLVPYSVCADIKKINPNVKVIILDKVAHLPFITHEKTFYDAVFS